MSDHVVVVVGPFENSAIGPFGDPGDASRWAADRDLNRHPAVERVLVLEIEKPGRY